MLDGSLIRMLVVSGSVTLSRRLRDGVSLFREPAEERENLAEGLLLRKPPSLIAQLFRRPGQPDHKQSIDHGSNRPTRRDQQHPWRFVLRNESSKMVRHRCDVS